MTYVEAADTSLEAQNRAIGGWHPEPLATKGITFLLGAYAAGAAIAVAAPLIGDDVTTAEFAPQRLPEQQSKVLYVLSDQDTQVLDQWDTRLGRTFVEHGNSEISELVVADDSADDDRQTALDRVSAISPRIATRLHYIASLDAGWDGFCGTPITDEALSMCSLMLEAINAQFPREEDPSILPLADGGIQLDWYYSRVEELTIEIPPAGVAAGFLAEYEDGRLYEGEFTLGTFRSMLLSL